jgi:carboxypeptidase D
MRCSTILGGLLSVAAVAEARSWQHVGKKQTNQFAARSESNPLEHYLATRQVPKPRFANSNTASKSIHVHGVLIHT